MSKKQDPNKDLRDLSVKMVSPEMFEAYISNGGQLDREELIEAEFQSLLVQREQRQAKEKSS